MQVRNEQARSSVKQFVADRPLAFALLLAIATAVIGLSSDWLGAAWAGSPVFLLPTTLFAIILLTALGWWRAAGFNGPAHWHSLQVTWLPLLIALLPLAGIAAGSISLPGAATISSAAVVLCLVAFNEEAVFRGIMLNALLPEGRLRAVVLSALIFGLWHATGVTGVMEKHWLFVLMQIPLNIGAGFMFGAIRLRTGTIWVPFVIHWLFDFLGALATPEGTLVVKDAPSAGMMIYLGGLGLVYTAYGLFLLRHDLRARRASKPPQPEVAS